LTWIAYQQFTDKYQKLKKEDKWTLSTGEIVEDTVHLSIWNEV